MTEAAKRLYLSRTDKKLAGVCGGVAAYLGLDSTVVRVLFIVLAFVGLTGVIAYLALALLAPQEPTAQPPLPPTEPRRN